MLVNKIVFKNFMAYYGEVEFLLDTKGEQNVTIVYAPNDVGKSCFFKGFTFCLYGRERGEKHLDLINRNALKEGIYEAHVSIFAEHNSERISITRTIKSRAIGGENISEAQLEVDLKVWRNDTNLEPEPIEFINSLVHEDAAKYFFFDGEKVNAYNIASANEYKDAILRILGIKEVEFAASDLDNIVSEYEKELDQILIKASAGAKLVDEKKKIVEEIDKHKKDIADFERERKAIQARIVEKEDELKENEAIASKIEEKRKLQLELNAVKDEAKRIDEQRASMFKMNGTMVLGAQLAGQYRGQVMELVSSPTTVLPNKELLLQVLLGDTCVCGESLTLMRREHIESLISRAEQQDQDWQRKSERKAAIQTLDIYLQHALEAKNRYLQLCKDKVERNARMNQLSRDILDLQTSVSSFDETMTQKLSEEIAREQYRERDFDTKIIKAQTLLEEREKDLNEIQKKIDKMKIGKQKEILEKKIAFAQGVANAFKDYQETLIRAKREEVERNSSEIFLQLTNKPNKYRALKLREDYQLIIELTDGTDYEIEHGRSLNPSTGQSKIISLSYIAGINKSTNSVAPVVIDNPVGLFSEEHRERVVNYIPKFGKQVIFMVTGADLGPQYRRLIDPFVRRAYYLEDAADSIWNKTRIAKVEEY